MANTIKLKRSAVPGKVPTTSDLALGELGLNTYDGKLYTKKDNGAESVVEIGSDAPGGSDTQIQFNDGGVFGGDVDFTYDKTTNQLTNKGDILLDDGGLFTTTIQVVTPTANRAITFPDATGTVALIGGASGNIITNQASGYTGVVNSSVDLSTGNVTLGSRITVNLNGASSSPPASITGTWFSGGTTTTTKPQVLIEPAGTTSTGWSTSGTGLGINAPSGFAGRLLDLQVNGSSIAHITNGTLFLTNTANANFGVTIANTTGSRQGSIVIGQDVGQAVANLYTPDVVTQRIFLNSTAAISWSSLASINGASSSADLFILRDAAHTLAQRSGSNAQTFRCYGTFTDSSNYVRASLSSTSTAVTLAAQTAGTGADNIPLNLTAAGTGAVRVNSDLEIADAKNIVLGTGTGTKIGTATTQKLGFYNSAPIVQPAAVTDIVTTATVGSLPAPDGNVTIADAAAPTVTELLDYCVELEAKLEAALQRLRTLGLIAS